MGYYTRYRLRIEPDQTLEFVNGLGLDAEAGATHWITAPAPHFPPGPPPGHFLPWGGDLATWYAHESELARVSLKHPELLFILDGAGERPSDAWRKYFKGGLVQTWSLEGKKPDPIDPEKLGPP